MKRITLTITLLALLVLGIGCSAAAPNQSTQDYIPSTAPMAAQPTGAPAARAGTDNGVAEGGYAPAPPVDGDSSAMQSQAEERMIVYTGNLSLQVDDTADTINKINTLLAGVNGYISSRSVVEYGENKLRGTISIRVPANQLESTLTQIRALGIKVLKESQDSNDVTAEFTDLDARRKNLEAYEVELQKLLETVRERTGKAEDILAVYNQLTQVRGEIEQIKGRQNYLQNTSALATYTIELVPVEEVVVQGDPGWNPGTTVSLALDRLVSILQGLADVAINLAIIVLPVLLIVIAPIVILFLIVRAFVKRRSGKKVVAA